MAIPYEHGTSFDIARCIQCWKEYPFASFGDSSTIVYHHIMEMNGDNYAPLALDTTLTTASTKPLGSLFADDATAYFVEDRGLASAGNNLVTFDRIFSQIPAGYTEGGGLYSFTFPSCTAGNLTVNIANGGTAASGNTWKLTFSLLNADSVNFNIGDSVVLRGSGSFTPIGGTSTSRSYWKYVITLKNGLNSGVFPAPASGWVSYEAILEGGEAITSLSPPLSSPLPIDKNGTLERSSAITLNSESIIESRFVKTDDINEEHMADRFEVFGYGGADYTLEDTVGVTTLPDIELYKGMARKGIYIQAEPETPERWMGNIWRIVGRKVRVR